MSAEAQRSSQAASRLLCRTSAEDPSRVSAQLAGADISWISPGTKLAAFGAAWSYGVPATPARFAQASAALHALFSNADVHDEVDVPGSGPVALGAFSFDWQAGGSRLVVPSIILGASDSVAWRTEIRVAGTDGPARHEPPSAGEQVVLPEPARDEEPDGGFAGWQKGFDLVRRSLEEGSLQKLVLARKVRLIAKSRFDRQTLLPTLARQFPGCYSFCFGNFIGASPELLIRKLGPIVDSMPIAGSAPRGTDEQADQELGIALMASAKDQLEHELTKQWVVSALGPLCATLEAEPEPSLLLLSNLQHLSTKVQGRLSENPDSLELVGALHPTPAVCGVPGDRALETIRSVEKFSRGLYAGPIGWTDHRGDGEWAIALRCAEIDGSSAALYAGAGILAASDARSEFEETELKLQAIRGGLAQGPH